LDSGERLEVLGDGFREEVYPRNPYLQLRPGERNLQYGPVDNINPAVEVIFELLGQNTSEQKVTIIMQLPDLIYPGARTERYSQDISPEDGWYSMDLPNLMENFRSLHAPRVEVLWKSKECRQELEEQQPIMKSIGWDATVLLPAEDYLHPHPEYHGCHRPTDEWRIAKYVLRREGLTEPLFAQEPCPYHKMSLDLAEASLIESGASASTSLEPDRGMSWGSAHVPI